MGLSDTSVIEQRNTQGDREMAKQAGVAEVIFENEDYFVAKLLNGWVRVGMFEVCAVDFPPHHAEFAEAMALSELTVEAFCDRQVEEGRFLVIG